MISGPNRDAEARAAGRALDRVNTIIDPVDTLLELQKVQKNIRHQEDRNRQEVEQEREKAFHLRLGAAFFLWCEAAVVPWLATRSVIATAATFGVTTVLIKIFSNRSDKKIWIDAEAERKTSKDILSATKHRAGEMEHNICAERLNAFAVHPRLEEACRAYPDLTGMFAKAHIDAQKAQTAVGGRPLLGGLGSNRP